MDESGFMHDMPHTHGYSIKWERCFGKQDWGAKGRTNAIGALLNLLKEHNILEQHVILAPNKIMSEEDYIKKIIEFILKYNLTSVSLVAYNYDMPSIINELTKAVSYSKNVYIVPYPVASKQNYMIFLDVITII